MQFVGESNCNGSKVKFRLSFTALDKNEISERKKAKLTKKKTMF